MEVAEMMDQDILQKTVFKITLLILVLSVLDLALLQPNAEARTILAMVITISLLILVADIVLIRKRIKKEMQQESQVGEELLQVLENRQKD